MNDLIISNFADKILSTCLKEVLINGNKFVLHKGHDYSINNQDGDLAETNYFGKELEFILIGSNFKMPVSIQLYENGRGHYRIFVFNNQGMLTSVNLSTGFTDGEIDLVIQLKLSSRDMTKEEREKCRDTMVCDIETEGIEIIKKNTVYFGKYNVANERFIDTTAEKFLEQLIKVAVIKGHYMKNKGYELNIL